MSFGGQEYVVSDAHETRRLVREVITNGVARPVPTRSIEARVHSVGCSGLRTISIRGFRLSSGEGGHVAGFDLGPGPEEHLLGAVGASLAQAVAQVACEQDLLIDRLDLRLEAAITTDQSPGRIVAIEAVARIETDEQAAAFDGIEPAVLAKSNVAATLRIPIDLTVELLPTDPDRLAAGDWQI